CGQNMILRAQMDYLAESGLEYARGLILNPPEPNEYWTGEVGLQIVQDSNDYYDVGVVLFAGDPNDPNQPCDYEITSTAYRKKGIDRIGQSSLTAELRVDPNAADPNAEAFFTSITR
ncbi:MAG: hypothetical protein KAI59_04450, partial [Planctomycetes bacterium]|nr:hypothetical protein [Planctomycetota bacterium]